MPNMRRWILVLMCWAPTASALWVECPDGNGWAGTLEQIGSCECCVVCEDGSWFVEGEGTCASEPGAASEVAEYGPDWADDSFLGLQDEAVQDAVLMFAMFAALFLPTFVGFFRKHPQTNAIFLTNLFLGWTLIGWVVALIWSATDIKKEG